MNRYWRRRLRRHAILAITCAAIVAPVALALDDGIPVFRLSMGTAYASLVLLALALVLGPWNLLLARPNPVSSDVRRDIGIWAAIAGVAHIVFGLQVHVPGRMMEYFLMPGPAGGFTGVRYDLSGATNWLGLIAGLVLLLLMAISNDYALRRLGTRRWKSLQRWNYWLFALIAVHGAAYQILERRATPWVVMFAAVLLTVAGTQLAGFRYYRRRERAMSATGVPPEPPRSMPRPSSPRD